MLIPPPEEQRRIAEILNTMDESIVFAERIVSKLHETFLPLMRDVLAEVDRAPSRPLREFGKWLSGGTPSTTIPVYWDGGIPWITASSLTEKYLTRSDRTLTREGVRAGSRVVQKGAILFVVRGMSLKNEFRVGIAGSNIAFGQDCKAIELAAGLVPEYVWAQLRHRESSILRLVDEASHGTGRLQTRLIGNIEIPVPALQDQERVIARIRALEERIIAEERQLDKLRELRTGLVTDLLTGRVRTVSV